MASSQDRRGRRFLIRASAEAPPTGLSLNGSRLELEKMFEIPSRTGQQGVAPVQAWYATEIDQPLEENPWDAAHMLGRGDAAFSAAGVSLVEPDLEQSAFPTSPARTDLLQAVADPCFKNPQDRRLPRGATADWHLGTAYSP